MLLCKIIDVFDGIYEGTLSRSIHRDLSRML